MMRFIHTSDWHLGQDFYSYDRTLEQKAFLSQLAELVGKEKPDALLVSGDVYHNPTPQNVTVQMYNEGLLSIHKACPEMRIIVIAGNHDSASKLYADGALWAEVGVDVVSVIRKDSPAEDYVFTIPGKGIVVAAPYTYKANYPAVDGVEKEDRRKNWFRTVLSEVDASNVDKLPVVMMMHDAVNGCNYAGHDEKIVGGIQAADFKEISLEGDDCGYDYLALGHIHCPQVVKGTDGKGVYCGSPIPVSFDEDYEHYVNLVTVDARGAEPVIETVAVDNAVPVMTYPDEPCKIDDLLAELDKLDGTKPVYLRANVLRKRSDNIAGYPGRIMDRLGGNSQVRYCCLALTVEDEGDKAAEESKAVNLTIDEFQGKTPLDMARLYYAQSFGEELPAEMENMISQAIMENASR